MKRLLLILNPRAGQRKACRYLADIIDVFNRAGYIVITHITGGPGDGAEAVLRLSGDVELVVCCGGDGTLGEILSAIIKSGTDMPVGYIPAGSTNDFATGLRLSTDLVQAARDIVEGEDKRLDIGSFNNRYFCYVASFGAFTKTSYSTPQDMKNVLGHAAYILSSVQEISRIKQHRVRLELSDGRIIEDDFVFGAITNSKSLGGVVTLSDDIVDLSDGKFEMFFIRHPKNRDELRDCIQALRNKTYDCGMIRFAAAKSIKITASEDMDWTLDGEKEAGRRNIEVMCMHKAIRLRCKNI